jgi:hypothetical protein
LVRQYESQVEGRHQAMLVQIMRPVWPSDLTGEKFQEALLQWELDIQNYEHQSGELLPDKTKIAIVIASAPRAFRAAIATGHPSNRATYTALKVSLETLIQAERVYDGSGFRKDDAMQVDALRYGKNNHAKGFGIRQSVAQEWVDSLPRRSGWCCARRTGRPPREPVETVMGTPAVTISSSSKGKGKTYGSKGKDDESDEIYDKGRDHHAMETDALNVNESQGDECLFCSHEIDWYQSRTDCRWCHRGPFHIVHERRHQLVCPDREPETLDARGKGDKSKSKDHGGKGHQGRGPYAKERPKGKRQRKRRRDAREGQG